MNIQQRMIAVMQEIGFISKERKAPQLIGGYNFRGIDDFYAAIQPALIKCGVFVVPTVKDIKREERTTKSGGVSITTLLTIDYTFYGEEGDSITATVIGEGSDSTDKGCNKAMSSAFKYLASQSWCIPTEDASLDTEANVPEELAVQDIPVEKPKDDSKEWYMTLKETLANMCQQDAPLAVCESILLIDKQNSSIPTDEDPVKHTLLAVLKKRGVTLSKAGPKGMTPAIGKEVLELFSKYVVASNDPA